MDSTSQIAGEATQIKSIVSPRRDIWLISLSALTAVCMAAAIYCSFFYAPADAIQGQVQRIFYIHVPMAWVAYLAFFIVFIASIIYLKTRDKKWDQLARASAEIGLVFTTLVLITGSLWGRPIWGTWWTWDARLTTTLILWFIYLGYIMLRAYSSGGERTARLAAVLGIIGFIDVPIVHLSVTWWRTLHPQAIVLNTSGPQLPAEMLTTLMISLTAFTLLYAVLLLGVFRVERLRDELQGLLTINQQADGGFIDER